MPVMDGYSATALLRQQGHKLPIVALTANAMKGDEDKCLAAGCSGFQPKPIKVDELLSYLADLLGVSSVASNETLTTPDHDVAKPLPQVFDQINAGLAKLRSQAAFGSEPRVPMARKPGAASIATPIRSTLALDDPEFLEIVSSFVIRLRDRVAELEAAWDRRDLPEVAQIAHWLRGAAGTMGFGHFTEPSTTLMRLVHNEQLDQIDDVLAEISHLVSRIRVPVGEELLVGT